MRHYRIVSPLSGADYGVWHGVDAEDVLRQLYHMIDVPWPGPEAAGEAFAAEEISEREAERLTQYCP